MKTKMSLNLLLLLLVGAAAAAVVVTGDVAGGKGHFELLCESIGISAMHLSLLPITGKLVAFDRTDFGRSNISLLDGQCRNDPNDLVLHRDCTAHSVEVDPNTGDVRPLTVLTDTWCSSGVHAPDGRLLQTGGYNDGDKVVRYLSPCKNCDWEEDDKALAVRRWYATDHLLPDGRAVIVGGRGQFSYEFYPKTDVGGAIDLPFLLETKDKWENNLYPFVHLSPDGNLFVFANTKAILLDYKRNKVVRKYADIPGGYARNYPSSGSSVLLPLRLDRYRRGGVVEADVMICGGAEPTASSKAGEGVYLPAATTCGIVRITEESPEWRMKEMPTARVMGDMVLLPTGDVLIINGAANGTAGWGFATNPVLTPVLYRTGKESFEVLKASAIPRMYHSTAVLVPDGRVVVSGSNPNQKYVFAGVPFPTEMSLEVFSPPYMSLAGRRPEKVTVESAEEVRYGQSIEVAFEVVIADGGGRGKVEVVLIAPSFVTHAFSMNQRMVVLEVSSGGRLGGRRGNGDEKDARVSAVVKAVAPADGRVAPPGYYMLFVVVDDVPGAATWIRIVSSS